MAETYEEALVAERANALAASKADRVQAVDAELARIGAGPKTPVAPETATRPPADNAALPKPTNRRK